MLDFRIETFLAACRHMNFTAAAEELHITQPAGIPAYPVPGKEIRRRAVCPGREAAGADPGRERSLNGP